VNSFVLPYAQNPLNTFRRNFPVDGGGCQLVSNLLATSRCNGIWETTRHNRHNGLLFARANLLWTCYRLVVYVADLLATQRESRQLVTDLLQGNWCNGVWPLWWIKITSNSKVSCNR